MTTLVNKPPWAGRKHNGPLPTPNPDDLIDREFATRFIAERMELKYGTIRAQRDKIGKQIDTALSTGKLKSQNGKFPFNELIVWVRTKKRLAKSVDGLPTIGRASVAMAMPSPQIRISGYSLPTMPEDCQEALRDAYSELNQCREENARLQATVAELTPLKVKAAARSRAAQLAGKKGGRPKK